jgi:hypothetical protein
VTGFDRDRRVSPDAIGSVPCGDSAVDAFEASFSSTASATAEHVADVAAKIRQGMIKVRILDGIVRNVYANNPGKLAAWLSASHVEKAPKKKATPTS